MADLVVIETEEASTIKILVDILSQLFQRVELRITKTFIKIEHTTDDNNIFLCACLERKNFKEYTVPDNMKDDDVIKITVQTALFVQCMQAVKKKNILRMSIASADLDNFNITIFDKIGKRTSYRSMKLVDSPPVLDTPVIQEPDYTDANQFALTVNSDALQSGAKSVIKAAKKVSLKLQKGSINMGSGISGLTCMAEVFGNPWNPDETVLFEKVLKANTFSDVFKITAFWKRVHFYADYGGPLLMSTRLGGLGEIRIYILQ